MRFKTAARWCAALAATGALTGGASAAQAARVPSTEPGVPTGQVSVQLFNYVAYLLTGQTPAAGTVCTGDVQPFTEPLGSEPGPQSRGAAPSRPLPPVVPPLPGAVPRS